MRKKLALVFLVFLFLSTFLVLGACQAPSSTPPASPAPPLPAPAPPPPAPPPAGGWTHHAEQHRDQEDPYIETVSDDGATLGLYCADQSTLAIDLDERFRIGGGGSVMVQLGDSAAERVVYDEHPGGVEIYLRASKAPRLMGEDRERVCAWFEGARNAELLHVRLINYKRQEGVYIFNLSGLAQALEERDCPQICDDPSFAQTYRSTRYSTGGGSSRVWRDEYLPGQVAEIVLQGYTLIFSYPDGGTLRRKVLREGEWLIVPGDADGARYRIKGSTLELWDDDGLIRTARR